MLSLQVQLVAQENTAKQPAESEKLFKVPNDLRIDTLLAEPEIAQPLFCNFDERGRMWVVEYRQYPDPAGLKVISKDQYYRTVYDKIPAAPPNHVRGKDRISIHEDTNGDGNFDSHKIFVEGLNIATAVERGRGGVWVLNPPYLLFYPDKDNDDVPDSDPIVHLQGFGLEDTHSCTNSLRWGPDGWLYAAQGSTVTGNIIRPGIDKNPIRSMGQLIWRYHPERKIYEIFAEGGGNAFGVEIDKAGRIFSGHNGGDTRGFHYPQGGYLRKGFTKHGALSNPFAFGYFPHMKHARVQRFTHNFIIYEADALPETYHGKLFGIEPLQGRVVETEIKRRGSTFETQDIQFPVTTADSWFTPVDIKLGPDGGIYVCDWYDDNVSHLEASVGKTDKADGRIYRLTGKTASASEKFNMLEMPTSRLVEYLKHSNRWFRQTALRVLGDRKDKSVLGVLRANLSQNQSQLALESLWAIYQINDGDLTVEIGSGILQHENPQVRKWAFRLICDENKLPESIQTSLIEFVTKETDVETRTQIASSAKRLPSDSCLKIVKALLHHQSDTSDPYQPLLIWWAIESKCGDGETIASWINESNDFWNNRIVIDHIAERLAKRFTMPGTQKDFLVLASLLDLARESNPTLAKKMLGAFEESTKAYTNVDFPKELLTAISKSGGTSLELQVRQNDMEAIESALETLADSKSTTVQRVRLIRALGEVKAKESIELFFKILKSSENDALKIASLEALQKFADLKIGNRIAGILPMLSIESRKVAESVIVTRASWTQALLNKISKKSIDPKSLADATVRRMLFHQDAKIQANIRTIFGEVRGSTDAKMRETIATYLKDLTANEGSPYEGKKLFTKHCAKCHRLYQNGGDIGPNLTSYQRNDLKLMLLHVVNPNAEIREGFENIMFALDDGRIVSGFVKEQDNRQIVVRTSEGSDIRIDIDSIENRKAVPQSLMPTKLLAPLTPQQRRDLFAYLRSTQPLNN